MSHGYYSFFVRQGNGRKDKFFELSIIEALSSKLQTVVKILDLKKTKNKEAQLLVMIFF